MRKVNSVKCADNTAEIVLDTLGGNVCLEYTSEAGIVWVPIRDDYLDPIIGFLQEAKKRHGEPCDHIVGMDTNHYDGNTWLPTGDSVLNRGLSPWPDETFDYCPNCGASLKAFWAEVDARAAARREKIVSGK